MLIFVFITIFLVLIAFLFYMWTEAHQNVVERRDLTLDNLPRGFDGKRLFLITDIHRRIVSETIIQEVKREVEMVIIAGDLTEKGVPFRWVEENIDRLSRIGPIYFVWGNNDYEVDYRRLDALLNDKGVTVLDNTAAQLEAEGDKLQLLGVDDYGLGRDRLDLAVEDSSESFRILISHNPALAKNIVNEVARIRLVLSGHTHGGQIRLFGWGPREKGGLKQYPGLTLFVSNGYGTTTLPLRLGAPAQTHILTLIRHSTHE